MTRKRREVIPLQPEPGANLPAPVREAVRASVEAHRARPGNLLLVLQAVQERLDCVPPDAIPLIAFELNRSRAEVHGVLSFYHGLRTHPPGRRVLQLCRAEACQSVGGRELAQHAQSRLGIGLHQTTADGALTLEAVYCLGNCALGPAVMLDGELHGRVDPARLDTLLQGTGS